VCELVNTPAFAITVEKHRAVLRACETLNVAVTRVCFRFPVRPDAENKLNREEGGEG
jgi:hypothetical protein